MLSHIATYPGITLLLRVPVQRGIVAGNIGVGTVWGYGGERFVRILVDEAVSTAAAVIASVGSASSDDI